MDNDIPLIPVGSSDPVPVLEPVDDPTLDIQSMDRDTHLQTRIAELTSLLTPIPDMAVLLNITESSLVELLDDRTTVCSQIYRRKRAEMALEVRQRDIALARAGSPTSAENVAHYLSISEL